MSAKPKVAFFDFAGCEGDQLQIANLEERILDIVSHIEIVSFREVKTEHVDDYDIAFVEGSITRPEDEQRIKEIRKNAKILIALGACATIGGINCLKNFLTKQEYTSIVYGPYARYYSTYAARPVSAVVPVDGEIHGCPIDKEEFVLVVKSLLLGKSYVPPDYPVCVECKKAGNICRFEQGRLCLGIVTRAGCNAACITAGSVCWGCRGPVPGANLDAARQVMDEHGFNWLEAEDKLRLYMGHFFKARG
ncbi:NADH-quinone oxidoreductase subunit B family protein [Desulfonauticus submarinus]